MSSYFFKRIKNLPVTTNSNNPPIVVHPTKPTVKPDDETALSDDELLASVLQFEQTPQFRRAEQGAKKAKG